MEKKNFLVSSQVVFPGVIPHQQGKWQISSFFNNSKISVCASLLVSVGANVGVKGMGVRVGSGCVIVGVSVNFEVVKEGGNVNGGSFIGTDVEIFTDVEVMEGAIKVGVRSLTTLLLEQATTDKRRK